MKKNKISSSKVVIVSSVEDWIFANATNIDIFSEAEKNAALKEEIDVFVQHLKLDYLKKYVQFELIKAFDVDQINKTDWDAFILWGSPHMATESYKWIDNLTDFVYKQVNAWKPVLWICFWHQILAKAFWWKIWTLPKRHIWADILFINQKGINDKLFSNLDKNLTTLWSHKQIVEDVWEWESLWEDNIWKNQIIRIWDNAWWVQFHPEFTADFMSFLVKLMKNSLKEDWIDIKSILRHLKKLKWSNPSSKLIHLFISQYL